MNLQWTVIMDVLTATQCFKVILIALVFRQKSALASKQRAKSLYNILTTFNDIGPKMCERRCSQFSSCSAISYRRSDMYCELIKDEEEVQFVEDDNFMFSKAVDFQIDNNACWPNPCSLGQKCVIGNSGIPICMTHGYKLTDEDLDNIIKHRGNTFVNVAPGKPTSQSPFFDHEYNSSKAIDGDLSSFSVTDYFDPTKHTDVYWMIDLQELSVVKQINITPRSGYADYIRCMDVSVGMTETDQKLCYHFVGPATNDKIIINCHDKLVGRFVKLTVPKPTKDQSLQFVEIEVYASM